MRAPRGGSVAARGSEQNERTSHRDFEQVCAAYEARLGAYGAASRPATVGGGRRNSPGRILPVMTLDCCAAIATVLGTGVWWGVAVGMLGGLVVELTFISLS